MEHTKHNLGEVVAVHPNSDSTPSILQLHTLLPQPLPSVELIFKKWTKKQRQSPMSCTLLMQGLRRQSSGWNCRNPGGFLQRWALGACSPPLIVFLLGLQRHRALNAELG